jgi:hypothetical protein
MKPLNGNHIHVIIEAFSKLKAAGQKEACSYWRMQDCGRVFGVECAWDLDAPGNITASNTSPQHRLENAPSRQTLT